MKTYLAVQCRLQVFRMMRLAKIMIMKTRVLLASTNRKIVNKEARMGNSYLMALTMEKEDLNCK